MPEEPEAAFPVRGTVKKILITATVGGLSFVVSSFANFATSSDTVGRWTGTHSELVWTALMVLTTLLVSSIVFTLKRPEEILVEAPVEETVDRVRDVQNALTNADSVLNDLRAELEARSAALKALQTSTAHYEQLASLHRDQAQAVDRAIEAALHRVVDEQEKHREQALRRQEKRSLRRDVLLLFLGAILGVVGNWVAQATWDPIYNLMSLGIPGFSVVGGG